MVLENIIATSRTGATGDVTRSHRTVDQGIDKVGEMAGTGVGGHAPAPSPARRRGDQRGARRRHGGRHAAVMTAEQNRPVELLAPRPRPPLTTDAGTALRPAQKATREAEAIAASTPSDVAVVRPHQREAHR